MPPALSAWIAELASVFPYLSRPQVKMLAQYSMGMVLAESSGLCRVAFSLSQWLQERYQTTRERLRDFHCGGCDKSGRQRRDLDVSACFPNLLAWILRRWQSSQLALAIDATTLGQRFTVLVVSVVVAGCAIPVAWKVLPSHAKGSWKAHWLRLLLSCKDIVPPTISVLVLADRGLFARWLFQAIAGLGWHPYLRINITAGEFHRAGTSRYVPLKQLLQRPTNQA